MSTAPATSSPLSASRPTGEVAVVIPVWRGSLSDDEALSVASWRAHLEELPTFLLSPKGFDPSGLATSGSASKEATAGHPEALAELARRPTETFEARWFESRQSYNHLLMTEEFYRRFESFRYVLLFQLDCLAFSSDLSPFLEAAPDYLGAPWPADRNDPEKGLSRVGNGGLSLRRVAAALEVLTSPRFVERPISWLGGGMGQLFGPAPTDRPPWRHRLRVLREARRGVRWYCRHYGQNEDHFWSDRARLFDPAFRPAPVDLGLAFSFERFPQYCWRRNHHQLPFGCHAWAKFGREFWTPWLPQATGALPPTAPSIPSVPSARS